MMKKISFADDMAGVFIDRFGRDIPIRPAKKKGWSETSVDVALSDHFFGWIFALGTKVQITGPANVVKMFKDEIRERMKLYG